MAGKSLYAHFLVIVSLFASGCALHRGLTGPFTSPHTETHHSNKDEFQLREDITSFAKKHVGAKYKYGGKSPTGFDCSGFTTYVLRNFDVPVSGPSASQERLGRKTTKEKAQPGDLVFFRKSKAGKVFHVAMVYSNDGGNLRLIHSTSSRGVVVDNLAQSSYWRSKTMTFRDVVSGR